jgi:hypothetical protein
MEKELLKLIYLYLFSAIGLILVVVGLIKLVDLGFKTFVFREADVYYTPVFFYPGEEKISPEELQRRVEEERKAEEINRRAQRQKEVSKALSMIIVGVPLYIYHWRLVMKTRKES